ncbi:MAG: hypothetical protein OHK93_006773 [Ramalina farinacea]|uniref:Uncharacterized protein n=1 Tax=Ramalina farinacea TaxID=258253 RepID=A0AA43TTE9_9LECA|nr:hypothetical protein [Ramalina farinacea]
MTDDPCLTNDSKKLRRIKLGSEDESLIGSNLAGSLADFASRHLDHRSNLKSSRDEISPEEERNLSGESIAVFFPGLLENGDVRAAEPATKYYHAAQIRAFLKKIEENTRETLKKFKGYKDGLPGETVSHTNIMIHLAPYSDDVQISAQLHNDVMRDQQILLESIIEA